MSTDYTPWDCWKGVKICAHVFAMSVALTQSVFWFESASAQSVIFLDGFETCEFYADADGDGFGDPDIRIDECPIPAGFVRNDDDCDDSSPSTFPGSSPADDPSACMKDVDDDDFGDRSPPPEVVGGSDCNDANPLVNPSVAESCDGLDNDCDGKVDEGNPGGGGSCDTGRPGICSIGALACEAGSLQCNETTSPEPESCDGLDNDCDGMVDEGNPGGGGSCDTGRPGICSTGTLACEAGSLQCNETTSPEPESCDGLDNDCDGEIDEGVCGAG